MTDNSPKADVFKDPVQEMLREKEEAARVQAAEEAAKAAAEAQGGEGELDMSLLADIQADIQKQGIGEGEQAEDGNIEAERVLETAPREIIAGSKERLAAKERAPGDEDAGGAGQPEVPVSHGGEVDPVLGGLITAEQAEQIKKEGKKRLPIGRRLIEKGIISKDQLEIALKVQRSSDEPIMIGAVLVQLGFLTESTLSELLSEQTGNEQLDLSSTIIDPNMVKQVTKDVAQSYKAVPVMLEGDTVHVAMTDIYDVLALDRIQRYFPKRFKLKPLHTSEPDLAKIIENYFDYELSIDGILREMEAMSENPEELVKISAEQDNYTNPTVRLIDALLVDAIQLGASDLHFEPEGPFVRLRYRIDGILQLVRSFHKDYWGAIAARIKIISSMNITETRNPQDGRISLTILGRPISFRVATQPTVHGENIVMRVLDKQKALLPMAKLGFSEANVKFLQKGLKRPEGIIIVTGPTGSGKTTTLYSILGFINKMEINIMTLEDPVEYELPMIRQSNIREGTGMDFISGIKSLMRQDPDVIFVGEVRDSDTANMAVRAAMTGHQVYTSLHTNDALGAIPRLVDIGVKPSLLSGNIICVVAQRLARSLCGNCKETYIANEEECKILKVDPDQPPEIYRAVGCEECNGRGYRGRIAISEVLLMNQELDELIINEASYAELMKVALKSGFIPMPDDGADKVLRGITTIDELVRTVDVTDRL